MSFNKTEITRIINGKKESLLDEVAKEVPLTIYLNDKELVTLLSSPTDLKALAVGFLYSSGMIKSYGDILAVTLDQERWSCYVATKNGVDLEGMLFKRLYTSGCGKGTLFYNALDFSQRKKIKSKKKITSAKIIDLMHRFQKISQGFRQTGGVHSAALSDSGNILLFKEDIGRHNAIDKIIGEAQIKGIKTDGLVVLSSGRISSEVIFKVKRLNTPIIASRTAPTDQAIKLAADFGLTLIGFVRLGRMNIYSHPERIT